METLVKQMSVGIAFRRRRQTEHYTPDTPLQKRPLLALPGLAIEGKKDEMLGNSIAPSVGTAMMMIIW